MLHSDSRAISRCGCLRQSAHESCVQYVTACCCTIESQKVVGVGRAIRRCSLQKPSEFAIVVALHTIARPLSGTNAEKKTPS
jgi:hypothetical protein